MLSSRTNGFSESIVCSRSQGHAGPAQRGHDLDQRVNSRSRGGRPDIDTLNHNAPTVPALSVTAFVLSLASTAGDPFGDCRPDFGRRAELKPDGAAQMSKSLAHGTEDPRQSYGGYRDVRDSGSQSCGCGSSKAAGRRQANSNRRLPTLPSPSALSDRFGSRPLGASPHGCRRSAANCAFAVPSEFQAIAARGRLS